VHHCRRTPCVLDCSLKGLVQTAFAIVSCAVPGLSEFYSLFVSSSQPWVCDISGEHLQSSKTRNLQDIRAVPQHLSAVVTCVVPGLSVFYSLVVSIWQPGWALFQSHTFWGHCSYSKRHSCKLFLQL